MIDPEKIEKIAHQIYKFIPRNICEFSKDIEKKICQILQTQIMRLDLVSSEEFKLQTQMLLYIQEKLINLEKRLADLENHRIIK